jgi:hypothetical protein
MTQIAANPAYSMIEDRLDAIGQRYRIQQLVRGIVLWLGWAIIISVLAAFAAHFLREGTRTKAVTVVWGAWLLASAILWLLRPLLLRPKIVEMARLVEKRVPGLHNGLTNSVLLATADDLSASPFLPSIFDEILSSTREQPLDSAVKWSDLNPLIGRLAIAAVPAMILAGIFSTQFAHGWQQMLAPSRFVPQVGAMQIVDVQPGDVTLVLGQPLEITAIAKGPQGDSQMPEGKLIFDTPIVNPSISIRGNESVASLTASAIEDGQLHYAYRLDHVDQPMRYRIEIGSTQSQWFSVNVVHDVKLTGMDFTITPPVYTKLASSTISIKPDEIDKTPIVVPQGSKVEIGASFDVPAKRAMLQVGQAQQIEMQPSQQNQRFAQTIAILSDTTISVGLMEGEQIIAKAPENGLVIHCKTDSPPSIQMKWPSQDGTSVSPRQDLTISAILSDDFGLSGARLLLGIGDAPLSVAGELPPTEFAGLTTKQVDFPIHLTPDQAKHGQSIHVQIEATDNRDLRDLMKAANLSSQDDGGPQTSHGPALEIKLIDPAELAAEQKDKTDKLRARLMEMLKDQQDLMAQAVGFKAGDKDGMNKINAGQTDLRNLMTDTADKFDFDATTAIVKRTLQTLAVNPAKDAIDLSAAIIAEPVAVEQLKLNVTLKADQQHIISTLESLLAMLKMSQDPTTKPANGNDPLLSKAEAYKNLDEALKEYMKQQQRILDQTASLAKKPVDQFDDNDKKNLKDLQMSQENLDAFMQQKIADFSKNAEQDMSNPDLLKDLFQIEDEVTMAKDALNKQATQIAVPAEENGLELAKEQSSNIEKWLSNAPDRTNWTQEDPLAKTDTPMPELPVQLEDMIGQLLEQQEDLFNQIEDQNANWQDSLDKGAGWDAADGPIADMSAKGVTGNVLPNNNEMDGRSGEGRNGQSQGEFVGDTAVGKGGRNTPTRLDPTPFQQGQINDTSKDPVGGATGGGKLSGQGGQGLEGPVPPKVNEEMQRLAQKQAELRNNAERLNLQYQLGRYDNFKLLQSIALMRRVESDLEANRYQNAMRRRDMTIDDLDTSKLLLGSQIHVEQDTTPQSNEKAQKEISDAMKGVLPPAFSDALKEYYQKLSQQ